MYSSLKGVNMTREKTYIAPKSMGITGPPPLPKGNHMSSEERKRAKEILSNIREQCLRKGLGGVKGLCVLFRAMDRDYSKTLTLEEVTEGLKAYKINIPDEDIAFAYNHFDKDLSGAIDFKEFLLALMPPMARCRTDVVLEAFDKLDHNKDGSLQEEDLMVSYRSHAESHPKYRSGEWTIEKVLKTFLSTFDSQNAPDGKVTREEFLQYYAGVSCTMDDDAYFDLMMRACWGLPQRAGSAKR